MEHLVVIGPSYDDLTSVLHEALEEVRQEAENDEVVWLMGDDAEQGTVESVCHESLQSSISIVFAGHGSQDALLTDPDLGSFAASVSDLHSVLIASTSLTPGKIYNIFAFCCRAGVGLGPHVARGGGVFIGFESNVFLMPGIGETKALTSLFGKALEVIEQSGGVDHSLERFLTEFYALEIRKLNDRGTDRLLRMCLKHQSESLCMRCPSLNSSLKEN